MLTCKEKDKLFEEFVERLYNNKIVYIECLDGVQIPEYSSKGDAGMDIRSNEDITLLPGETKIIHTGIKIAIPEGYEIQVRPRSGMSYKTPLRVSNAPGTIDSGYRDEVGIIITNISLKEEYKISKGDRIAQLVLCKYETITFEKVDDVKTIGNNRGGGFGHTGVN